MKDHTGLSKFLETDRLYTALSYTWGEAMHESLEKSHDSLETSQVPMGSFEGLLPDSASGSRLLHWHSHARITAKKGYVMVPITIVNSDFFQNTKCGYSDGAD